MSDLDKSGIRYSTEQATITDWMHRHTLLELPIQRSFLLTLDLQQSPQVGFESILK